MAARIEELAEQPERRATMGRDGARRAHAFFDLRRQAQSYLDWFDELREAHAAHANRVAGAHIGEE
jgi:glycosyltransferase involved in cell wall biosynthesis